MIALVENGPHEGRKGSYRCGRPIPTAVLSVGPKAAVPAYQVLHQLRCRRLPQVSSIKQERASGVVAVAVVAGETNQNTATESLFAELVHTTKNTIEPHRGLHLSATGNTYEHLVERSFSNTAVLEQARVTACQQCCKLMSD